MNSKRCFYCDATLYSDRLEYDHAPIPKMLGGTFTVPACLDCHDIKDRIEHLNYPNCSGIRGRRAQRTGAR